MSNILNYYQTISNKNIEGNFSLSRRKFTREQKKEIKIKRTKNINYDTMKNINIIFNEYIKSLKSDPKSLIHLIYKMELTGALIFVRNIPCLIVEERKNSIIVIYKDNSIKTLIKKGLVFYLEYKNVKYGVLGENLKINRFLKK